MLAFDVVKALGPKRAMPYLFVCMEELMSHTFSVQYVRMCIAKHAHDLYLHLVTVHSYVCRLTMYVNVLHEHSFISLVCIISLLAVLSHLKNVRYYHCLVFDASTMLHIRLAEIELVDVIISSMLQVKYLFFIPAYYSMYQPCVV